MTKEELSSNLGMYFAAVGITAERSAYCIPFLTGEEPIPAPAPRSEQSELEKRISTSKLITHPDAGELLGCSASTVRRFVKEGKLSVVNWRGKNRLRLHEVLALANDKGNE